LNDAREIDDLGLDEIAQGGVLAIEWADKLPARHDSKRPDRSGTGVVAVSIEHGDGDTRRITIDTAGYA
jgi:tRNA A37 threonylcarbamoyladenosine biosynthesis protein TsaE